MSAPAIYDAIDISRTETIDSIELRASLQISVAKPVSRQTWMESEGYLKDQMKRGILHMLYGKYVIQLTRVEEALIRNEDRQVIRGMIEAVVNEMRSGYPGKEEAK